MYRVYLVDPLVAIGKPALYLDVQRRLQEFFDQVSRAAPRSEQIMVQWMPATPAPQPRELLVYFTSEEFSVVSRFNGARFDPAGMSHWGYTQMKTINGRVTEAASEVYVKFMDADMLAKLAFHECMHNKLGTGQDLHRQGGLAAATVDAGSRLIADNIQRMAAALNNPVPQWTGGIQVLLTAKQRRDGGDSFWYL